MLLQRWVVPAVRLAFWCAESARYGFWVLCIPGPHFKGFKGHPTVKGDFQAEEVIPWEVTAERAGTWAYARPQLQELQILLQPGVLLTGRRPFI